MEICVLLKNILKIHPTGMATFYKKYLVGHLKLVMFKTLLVSQQVSRSCQNDENFLEIETSLVFRSNNFLNLSMLKRFLNLVQSSSLCHLLDFCKQKITPIYLGFWRFHTKDNNQCSIHLSGWVFKLLRFAVISNWAGSECQIESTNLYLMSDAGWGKLPCVRLV